MLQKMIDMIDMLISISQEKMMLTNISQEEMTLANASQEETTLNDELLWFDWVV